MKKKEKTKIQLGVNIDHIATLRQVRGGTTAYPDLLKMAQLALKAGAHQITIHLREDRRHIQLADVKALAAKKKIPLNLEMAVSGEMKKVVLATRPQWLCVVPERRQELTTEGGLDVSKVSKKLKTLIPEFQRNGVRVSLFIDPSLDQVRAAHEMGADAVEFHTGHWVLLGATGSDRKNGKRSDKKGSASERLIQQRIVQQRIVQQRIVQQRIAQQRKAQWKSLVACAELAHQLKMKVHAGHGLDFETAREIRSLPHLREVNIGHSLVCYSVEMGLREAIQRMLKALK